SEEDGTVFRILPLASRAFAGRPARLAQHVRDLLAGREVTITARVDEMRDFELVQSVRLDWVHGQKGRVGQFRIKPFTSDRDNSDYFLLGPGSVEPGQFVARGTGGPEVVPPLLKELQAKVEHVRAEAAVDLGLAGTHARSALSALRRAFRDPDPFVRL